MKDEEIIGKVQQYFNLAYERGRRDERERLRNSPQHPLVSGMETVRARVVMDEGYLREKYGAHRGHPEWRAIEAAFAAGAAAEREACAMAAKESLQRLGVDWAITEAVMKDIRARRTSTISPATLIDPRGSLGEPIV